MRTPAADVRPVRDWLPACWVGLAVGVAAAAGVASGAVPGVAPWSTPTGPAAPVAVLVGVVASRAVLDVAAVACVGTLLVVLLLDHRADQLTGDGPGRARRVAAAADRALVVAAGTWLAAVLAALVLRTADAYGRPVTGVGAAEVLAWSTRLGAGRGMLVTGACAVVVLLGAALRQRAGHRVGGDRATPWPGAVAAVLGVLTPSVTGHAGSAPLHEIAVLATALHAVAAAVWVGGLAAVLVLLGAHRGLLAVVLPPFSTAAAVCLVVVAGTGVVGALVRLGSPAELLSSGYGVLVLAKAAGTVALGVLGWAARRRLAAGRAPVLRWAGPEIATMAAVLGLAAALAQGAP